MAMADDPALSWAVTKALLIVASGFGSVLLLAGAATSKTLFRIDRRDKGHGRTAVKTKEANWTDKYKQALLERNTALRMSRIEDAQRVMTERALEIPETSSEKQLLERAFGILAMLREAR